MRLLGLPVDAWILLVFAVGLGLALELAFMRARRRDAARGEKAVTGASTGTRTSGSSRGRSP